ELLLREREPREPRHVHHLVSADRHLREILAKEGPPSGGPLFEFRKEVLDRLDVRGLGALGALDDLELHALALGQRLVAVHLDRREVDEDVLATLALDEPVALLIREPLHGALRQAFLLQQQETTARAPSRRPTIKRAEA